MDYTAEKHFVQTFIRKKRRERILHELASPAKRYDGISRFSHQAEELFDPSKIIMKGNCIENSTEFAQFVQKHNENCFTLSPDPSLNEKYLPVEDALIRASECADAVLILGNTFALVYSEAMKGGRDVYLLSADWRNI